MLSSVFCICDTIICIFITCNCVLFSEWLVEHFFLSEYMSLGFRTIYIKISLLHMLYTWKKSTESIGRNVEISAAKISLNNSWKVIVSNLGLS